MPVLLCIFLFLLFSPAAFSQQAGHSHSFLGEAAALAEKTPAYDFRDEFNRPLSKESFAFQLRQSELEQKANFFFKEDLPSTRQRLIPLKERLRTFFAFARIFPFRSAALALAAVSSPKRPEGPLSCPPWALGILFLLFLKSAFSSFVFIPQPKGFSILRC